MTFGITENGFVLKRIDDIKSELISEFKAAFGENIDVSADTPLGQIIAIVSEARANDWLALQAVYNSFFPNTASGISLDRVASLNAIVRREASFSTGILTFSGTPGVAVPVGTLVKDDTGRQVETTAAANIGIGGTVEIPCRAVSSGNVVFAPATLNKLVSSVFGTDEVGNAQEIAGGFSRETDQEFRLRRAESLQNPGTSGIEGIRNAITSLPFVLDAIIIENPENIEVDGRPPHSFQTYVLANLTGGIVPYPTERKIVATELWNAKPAGIQTVGELTETVTDSQGFTHEINFSEAVRVPVEISLSVSRNLDVLEGDLFPQNGADQVTEAILSYGSTLGLGRDVWLNKIVQAASSVSGVKGVSNILINGAAENLSLTMIEFPVFDADNITVNVI